MALNLIERATSVPRRFLGSRHSFGSKLTDLLEKEEKELQRKENASEEEIKDAFERLEGIKSFNEFTKYLMEIDRELIYTSKKHGNSLIGPNHLPVQISLDVESNPLAGLAHYLPGVSDERFGVYEYNKLYESFTGDDKKDDRLRILGILTGKVARVYTLLGARDIAMELLKTSGSVSSIYKTRRNF